MYADQKFAVIVKGILAGFVTFVGVEIAAAALSVIVRLVEEYTHWFNLGDSWNAWLGVVFLFWGALPAIFLGLIVCARTIKSGRNQESTSIR
ncbi:MAG TPA: hypothetical protein VFF64_29210 [Candidatus Eremiobacteraceae bacterium]|nr:hypothetical protein [Candidatus Eremiobacteraceae bacterium]